jgi:hypothetical protein
LSRPPCSDTEQSAKPQSQKRVRNRKTKSLASIMDRHSPRASERRDKEAREQSEPGPRPKPLVQALSPGSCKRETQRQTQRQTQKIESRTCQGWGLDCKQRGTRNPAARPSHSSVSGVGAAVQPLNWNLTVEQACTRRMQQLLCCNYVVWCSGIITSGEYYWLCLKKDKDTGATCGQK